MARPCWATGRWVLILNPVALSTARADGRSRARGRRRRAKVREEAVASPATLPTVMVVDDSLTVRKITGRLLAREGYQVLLAKDGVEALEELLDASCRT